MLRIYPLFILLVWLYSHAVTAEPLIEAQHAFQSGHYGQAISHWQTVLATTQNTNHRLEAWFGIARSYRWLGGYGHALENLETALAIAQQNPVYHALLLNELSKLRLSQGSRSHSLTSDDRLYQFHDQFS